MHRSAYDKMQAFRDVYLREYAQVPLSILDIGSAAVSTETASHRSLFGATPWRYRGLDMAPGPNVDVVPRDPYRWEEIADGSVDVVVSGQAFEHIEWPWLTIQEIARVLGGNGMAAILAPSAGPVHRFPRDCWRFYPDGLPSLGSYAGLRLVEAHWDNGYAYPDTALWGDAFAVLQRPAATAGDGQSWIAATASRDAIGRREAEMLAQLRPIEVRGQLLAEALRRIWFILRSPISRLTRL